MHVRFRLGGIRALDLLHRVGLGSLDLRRRHGNGSAALGAGPLLARLSDECVQPRTASAEEADMLLIGDRFGRRLAAFLVDFVRLGRARCLSLGVLPRSLQDHGVAAIRTGDFASHLVGRDLHESAAPSAKHRNVFQPRSRGRRRIVVLAEGVGIHGRGGCSRSAERPLRERPRAFGNRGRQSAARSGLSGPSSSCGKPGTKSNLRLRIHGWRGVIVENVLLEVRPPAFSRYLYGPMADRARPPLARLPCQGLQRRRAPRTTEVNEFLAGRHKDSRRLNMTLSIRVAHPGPCGNWVPSVVLRRASYRSPLQCLVRSSS